MTCPRTSKWFGGCRFEARYDEAGPDIAIMNRIQLKMSDDTSKVIMALRPKTYIHDICTRCGKVVERKGETA